MPGLFARQLKRNFPKSPYPNLLEGLLDNYLWMMVNMSTEIEDLSEDRSADLDSETIPQVQWQDRSGSPIPTLVERMNPEDAKYLKDKHVLARCLTSFVFFKMTGQRIGDMCSHLCLRC